MIWFLQNLNFELCYHTFQLPDYDNVIAMLLIIGVSIAPKHTLEEDTVNTKANNWKHQIVKNQGSKLIFGQ